MKLHGRHINVNIDSISNGQEMRTSWICKACGGGLGSRNRSRRDRL